MLPFLNIICRSSSSCSTFFIFRLYIKLSHLICGLAPVLCIYRGFRTHNPELVRNISNRIHIILSDDLRLFSSLSAVTSFFRSLNTSIRLRLHSLDRTHLRFVIPSRLVVLAHPSLPWPLSMGTELRSKVIQHTRQHVINCRLNRRAMEIKQLKTGFSGLRLSAPYIYERDW